MDRKEIGRMGEKIAENYLSKKGFEVLDRNYRKKWGELDLVVKKNNIMHFVEVKTVSQDIENISRETDNYRPEDNIHPRKLKRMYRTIESYLAEKDIDSEWRIDILAITLDLDARKGKCRFIENVFY